MKVKFQCPYCRAINSCGDDDLGTALACGSCNRVQQVPGHRFALGMVVGDYVLREQVRSRLGNIDYDAFQISLERPVMLKVVKPKFNGNERFIKDFLRMARATSQVVHPNLVYTYAAGYEDGVYFIARESMEGESLAVIIKRDGKLMPNLAIDMVRQVAEGLAYGWRQKQLLHGNLKPDYLHLAPFGLTKILDLGLATLDPEPEDEHIKGTPHYLCPERIIGEPLDARADIYSLGVIFYEALLNRFPFTGDTPMDVLQAHLHADLVPPHQVNPMINESLSLVVSTMLSRDPSGRYPNGAILADDLRLVSQGKPPKFAVEHNTVKVRVVEDGAEVAPIAEPLPVAKPTVDKGKRQSKVGSQVKPATTSQQPTKPYMFAAIASADQPSIAEINPQPPASEAGMKSIVLKPDRHHLQVKPKSSSSVRTPAVEDESKSSDGGKSKGRTKTGLSKHDTKPGPGGKKFSMHKMRTKPRPPTDD